MELQNLSPILSYVKKKKKKKKKKLGQVHIIRLVDIHNIYNRDPISIK